MWVIDDWHDWWRVLDVLFCGACVFFLFYKYGKNQWSWPKGVTTAWYALFAWSFTGFASCIEGLLTDSPYGFRLLMILVGAAATAACLRSDLFDESRSTKLQ